MSLSELYKGYTIRMGSNGAYIISLDGYCYSRDVRTLEDAHHIIDRSLLR